MVLQLTILYDILLDYKFLQSVGQISNCLFTFCFAAVICSFGETGVSREAGKVESNNTIKRVFKIYKTIL